MATRLPCRPGPCQAPASAAATDAARRLRRPWRLHPNRTRPIWRRLSCTTAHLGDGHSCSVMARSWANQTRHQYPRRLCATRAAAQAASPLAPPAGAAYVMRTKGSSPARASTSLMDSHIQQMKYTLYLLALLSLCWTPAPGRASPRPRAHKHCRLASRP
jgi:hypothetical protein